VKKWVGGLLAIGVVCLAFAGARGSSASGATQQAAPKLDVEIAIDGTASMASAIAQARQSGIAITHGVIQLLPDTQFSVVVFRDHGNPAGEYKLVQPFTRDEDLVRSAFGKINATYNPDPNNGPAESYNLAFRKSYSDTRMGWRPDASKIVLVIGDAEPNGAGTEGLPGCRDHSRDPEGLSTRHELANMRAAHRTLIMVREPSREVSVTLRCYESIAAGAYTGSLAENAGQDIVSTLVELITGAYAPLTLKPDLRAALRTARSGYTVKLQNPNLVSLTTNSIKVQLPRGFRYLRGTTSGATRAEPAVSGRLLTWSLSKVLPAHKQLRLHLAVHTPKRLGTYRSKAMASVQTAAGNALAPRTPTALLRVKRRLSAIAFAFNAKIGAGKTVVGHAGARSHGGRRLLGHQVSARGSVLLRRGLGVRVLLRATQLRLERLAGPTRARLTLRVVAAHGLAGCRPGSRATLQLFNSTDLRQDDSNDAYLRLSLPRACGGTIRRAAAISVSDS
jgi:hypothetical protein